jgi:hypothetical protein
MPLAWELRHSDNNFSWPLRPSGTLVSTGPTCGILLETGAPDYILLEDATSPSDVILLEDC